MVLLYAIAYAIRYRKNHFFGDFIFPYYAKNAVTKVTHEPISKTLFYLHFSPVVAIASNYL